MIDNRAENRGKLYLCQQRRRFLKKAAGAGLLAVAPASTLLAATVEFDPSRLAQLAKGFDGTVVGPDDAAYEGLRRTASFNPRYDRRPVAVALCKSEDGIANAIEFARQYELPIAVRSGGHDVLAASTCENGLIIDLGPMTAMQLSTNKKQIRIGAGVRAGSVNAVTGEQGLAVPLDCNSSVGVSGLTLGGGIGWFVGTKGASCDNVTSLRVVTVDGEIKIASTSQNESLLWGLLGGGGNFGIVSEWTFSTFEQGNVYCGAIVYPGSQLSAFLAFYRDQMAIAPDELTVEVVGLAHRDPVVIAIFRYSGDERHGIDVVRPFQEFGSPIAEGMSWRPYSALEALPSNVSQYLQWQDSAITGEDREHGSYWQGTTVRDLSDPTTGAIVDALDAAPRGWSFGLGHIMRGEFVRKLRRDTPLLRQPGAVTVHFDGGWSYRSQAGAMMSWIDQARESVASTSDGASDYINYMSSEDPSQVRGAYGEHYSRLAKIKHKYDPDNILNRNRNIEPSS
jgi:FAD/FMN-containing dehydrogenase